MRPATIFLIKLIFIALLTGRAAITFSAGISPANGSQLSTIHVMFEFDDIYGADQYDLSVFTGNDAGNRDKQKMVIRSQSKNLSILITEGLAFGNNYSWTFNAIKKGKLIYTSPLYRFSILASPRTDGYLFRQETNGIFTSHNDLLLIDHPGMAINRQGKPVWFLPLENDSLNKLVIRDLNFSPSGTITYLTSSGAYEKDLYGNLLWKGPDDGRISGISKEDYHHQFTKLADGSFIVCGFTYRPEQRASAASAPRFNTIIHYNADSSIRWHWDELKSMKNDPLFKQYAANSGGGHLNGFAIATGQQRIFLSFKNLSDVWVLNTATGLFEASIKQNLLQGTADFQQQHGPFLTAANEILIYNNNIREGEGKEDGNIHPSIMTFRYDTLTKKFTRLRNHTISASRYPEGIAGKEGYASETANGNILVCAGGVNYATEITPKGETVWESYFYKRTLTDTTWKPYSNYRCRNIVSLYPLYYTLQFVQQKNGQYIFRLHNAGSTAMSFELFFTRSGIKNSTRYQSKKLMPGASELFTLPVKWVGAKDFKGHIKPASINSTPKTYSYPAGAL